MTIDIHRLVADGMLNLDQVFHKANWRYADTITTMTLCCYGCDGCQPGEVEILLETAEAYGITAYRWIERDGGGTHECGEITLDRDEAVQGGEEYAAEHDEEPGEGETIQAIVETGYFGDADEDDIRAICKEATDYSQGYLLLPKGCFVGHPIGRMWTTNGYLQCEEYIQLDATYPRVSHAATALLRLINSPDQDT